MKKLTYEDKVKIYLEKKDGKSLSYIAKKISNRNRSYKIHDTTNR